MRKRQKSYRIPDKLPKLRRLPKVAELLYIQDLDGEIFPVIILEIVYAQTKKGKNTKKVIAVNVLSGHTIYNCMPHDLKSMD
jgi:hypothetical protein